MDVSSNYLRCARDRRRRRRISDCWRPSLLLRHTGSRVYTVQHLHRARPLLMDKCVADVHCIYREWRCDITAVTVYWLVLWWKNAFVDHAGDGRCGGRSMFMIGLYSPSLPVRLNRHRALVVVSAIWVTFGKPSSKGSARKTLSLPVYVMILVTKISLKNLVTILANLVKLTPTEVLSQNVCALILVLANPYTYTCNRHADYSG